MHVRGHQQELIARAQTIGRSGWRWPGSNFVEAVAEVPPFGAQFVSPRRPDQQLGQTPAPIFVSKVPPPDVVFTTFGNWFISPPQVPTFRPQDALLGPRGPPLPEAQADQELLFGRLVIHPPLVARRIAPSMRAGLAREVVFTAFGNTFISEPRDEGRRQPAPILRWPIPPEVIEIPPFGSSFISEQRDEGLFRQPASVLVSPTPPETPPFGSQLISDRRDDGIRQPRPVLVPQVPPPDVNQELLFGRLVIQQQILEREPGATLRWSVPDDLLSFTRHFISEPRDDGFRQPPPVLVWPIPEDLLSFGHQFTSQSQSRDEGIRQPAPLLIWQVPPEIDQELLFGRLITRQQVPEQEPGATLRWPIPDDLLSFTRSFISEARDDGFRQPAPILKWPIPEDLVSFGNKFISEFRDDGIRQPSPVLVWPIPDDLLSITNTVIIGPQFVEPQPAPILVWPIPPEIIPPFGSSVIIRPQFIEREPGAHIQWFVPPDVLFTAFGNTFISRARDDGFRQPTIVISKPPLAEIPPPFGSRFITRVLDEGFRQPPPVLKWPIPQDINQELLFGRLVTTRQRLAEETLNKQRDPWTRWFVPPDLLSFSNTIIIEPQFIEREKVGILRWPIPPDKIFTFGTRFVSEFRDDGVRQPPSILVWPVPPDRVIVPIVKIVAVDVLFGKNQPASVGFGKDQPATLKFGKKLPIDVKF